MRPIAAYYLLLHIQVMATPLIPKMANACPHGFVMALQIATVHTRKSGI